MTLSSEQRETSARGELLFLIADQDLRYPEVVSSLIDAIEAEARASLLAQLDEAEVREGELRAALEGTLHAGLPVSVADWPSWAQAARAALVHPDSTGAREP